MSWRDKADGTGVGERAQRGQKLRAYRLQQKERAQRPEIERKVQKGLRSSGRSVKTDKKEKRSRTTETAKGKEQDLPVPEEKRSKAAEPAKEQEQDLPVPDSAKVDRTKETKGPVRTRTRSPRRKASPVRTEKEVKSEEPDWEEDATEPHEEPPEESAEPSRPAGAEEEEEVPLEEEGTEDWSRYEDQPSYTRRTGQVTGISQGTQRIGTIPETREKRTGGTGSKSQEKKENTSPKVNKRAKEKEKTKSKARNANSLRRRRYQRGKRNLSFRVPQR